MIVKINKASHQARTSKWETFFLKLFIRAKLNDKIMLDAINFQGWSIQV